MSSGKKRPFCLNLNVLRWRRLWRGLSVYHGCRWFGVKCRRPIQWHFTHGTQSAKYWWVWHWFITKWWVCWYSVTWRNESFKFDKIISSNDHDKSESASSTNKTSMSLDICITWMSFLFFSMFIGISGIDMPYVGAALVLFVIVASCWIVKSAKYDFSVVKMVSTLRCTILSWAKIVCNSVEMAHFSVRTVSHCSYIGSHKCQRW